MMTDEERKKKKSESDKRYALKNKDKVAKYRKQWDAENRERRVAQNRASRWKHKAEKKVEDAAIDKQRQLNVIEFLEKRDGKLDKERS